mgnify:CR=1 FL=1|jgi:hypothetical protein
MADEIVYGKVPRRWRVKLDPAKHPKGHPNGSAAAYFYGCYFPQTDLCIGEMSARGTGMPKDVEWLDPPADTWEAPHVEAGQ